MSEEGFKRKLAAILSADVEGYSRLRASEKINYPVSGSGVIVMNHFSKFCNLRSLFSIGVICFFVSRTFFGYTFRTSFTVAGTTLR
jgi:hypothetical protein